MTGDDTSTEPTGGQYDEISVRDDLLVPVGDETVAASRYESPDLEEPTPALLMYIPYHKDDYVTYGGYDPLVRYLAAGGYRVVVADMVGTGASSGVKEKPFEAVEGEEAAEIVEWLADREWCDGTVGMFGKSYGGITALKGATERPDPLEAIVSIHAPYLGFRDYYMGGAFSLFGMGGHWTPLMQALQAKPPGRRDPDGRWADVWSERLEGLRETTPWLFQFLEHDTDGPYWREMDIPAEEIDVPTFAVSGWRDGYPHTTAEYFEKVDADKRLLLGPWRHIMPHRGRETAIDFRGEVLAWFDHHIKGVDSGAADAPEIAVWTERDGGGREGAGVWQTLDRWPWLDVAEETVSLALSPKGVVPAGEFTEGSVERDYEVDHTVGVDAADQGTPVDTSADDARSLTFETTPLERPVELTGSGVATVRVSASFSDPNVVVRVVDVSPDGEARMVTHGELKASHRDGHEEPEPVVAGDEYELEVPLKAKSHLFEPGHRIRIAVSGGFFPVMLPNNDHGILTVRSDADAPSTVTFPGRRYDPGEDLTADVAFDAPDRSMPLEPPTVLDSDQSIEVSREHLDDAATVRTVASELVDAPAGDLGYREEITAQVEADEPGSASVSRRTDITVEHGPETVEVEATSRTGHDLARATTRVRVDGEPLFEHTWTWNR